MSISGKWEIIVPRNDIMDAINKKITYHKDREDWWAARQAEIREKLQTNGIKIEDSVGDLFSFAAGAANTGRPGNVVSLDQSLVQILNEVTFKVHAHERKKREFKQWLEFFEYANQASYPFDFQTFQDFFLYKPDEEEEERLAVLGYTSVS